MSAVSREMMFYFCEPYFHTLDRWMKYDDRHLLCNRLQVMAALIEILNARYDPETTYEIVQTEKSEPLLPPVHPSAGETFCDGYDLHAFHTAGTLVSPAVFQTGGLYFQKNLLRALSFGNASTKENFRDSPAIIALKILFRLSKESGLASLYSSKDDYLGLEMRDLVPLVDLTPETWTLHDSLIANMVIIKAAAEAKRVAAVASTMTPNFTVIEAEPAEVMQNGTLSTAAVAVAASASQATPHATATVTFEAETEPTQQQANTDSLITDSVLMEVTKNMIADADSMFSDGTSCVYSHEGIESGARADIIPDATVIGTNANNVSVNEELPGDDAALTQLAMSDVLHDTSFNMSENNNDNENEEIKENEEMKEIEIEINNNMTVDADLLNDAIESDGEDEESVTLPSSIVILDKNQEVQDPSLENHEMEIEKKSVTSSSPQNVLEGHQNAVAVAVSCASSSAEIATRSAPTTTTTTSAATSSTLTDKETETDVKRVIAATENNGSDKIPVIETTVSPKRKRSSSTENEIVLEEGESEGKRASKRVQSVQTNKEKEKEKDEKKNSFSSPPGISSSRSSSRLSVSNDGEEKGSADATSTSTSNSAGRKAVRTAVKIIEKRIEGNKEELEKDNAKRRKITKTFGGAKNNNATKKGKSNEEGGKEGEEEEEEEGVNEDEWLFEHPSIGTKVAGIFQKSSKKSRIKTSTVFYGEVTKFLSESGENERDELYHILWEDGDEEDYDTCDLTEGVRRYKLAKKAR